MISSIEVEPDPAGRAGYAVIRLRGSGRLAGPMNFRIRRADYDRDVFGAHGWQAADALLRRRSTITDSGSASFR